MDFKVKDLMIYAMPEDTKDNSVKPDGGDCGDCSLCSGCSNCSGCSDCTGCSDCSGCSYCSQCSRCSGGTCSQPFRLNPPDEQLDSKELGALKSHLKEALAEVETKINEL